MKKILLGTTALIGAGMLASAASAAEPPKVTVSGFANFEAGFVSDDFDDAQRQRGFRNDTEINFNVDGKTDGGLGYGAMISLEADVGSGFDDADSSSADSDAEDQGFNASRTYLYVEGGFGRFEMGSTEGVEDLLKVDASNIARGTGGIDGDWRFFANTAPAAGNLIIARPDLPMAYGWGDAAGGPITPFGDKQNNNVNKISYYTPRWSGFQGGLSYAPDSSDRGQVVTMNDSTGNITGDNIAAAVNYSGQFNQVSVQAAATGEWGDNNTAAAEDLSAWNAGVILGFAGFSVGGSYGDWSDSYQPSGNDDSNYWTAGAAYENGPFGVSLTYMNSQLDVGGDTNDFDNVVLGADYQLAEGFTPFVEASWYNIDPAGGAADNDGTVVLVGALFGF
jgi:outer membrane protein OmpU